MGDKGDMGPIGPRGSKGDRVIFLINFYNQFLILICYRPLK